MNSQLGERERGEKKLFCWRAEEVGVLVHVHLCLEAESGG